MAGGWLGKAFGSLFRVKDTGALLPQRTTVNFSGTGLALADDPANDQTNITFTAPTATSTSVQPVKAVATSSITASGTQVIDDVSCGVGDRVLRAGDGAGNGTWVVAAGAWSRSTDLIQTGMFVPVMLGTANKGRTYRLTTAAPFTVGIDSLKFLPYESRIDARGFAVADNSTDDRANLALALAVSNDVELTSVPAGSTYRVGSNGTLGAVGQTWHFARGAKIRVPSGVTLTVRGQINAAPDQWIFQVDSGGTLSTPDLGHGVHAAWWGCKPGDTAYDNAVCLLAAFASAPGREFLFGDGTYSFLTACHWIVPDPGLGITFTEAPKLRGVGRDRTIFDCRAAGVAAGTCTVTAATNLINKTAHGFLAGDFVFFTTTGTLPAGTPQGLRVGEFYCVLASGLTADAFKVAIAPGGTEMDLTDAGTGTHSVGKMVPAFRFDSALVATAKFLRGLSIQEIGFSGALAAPVNASLLMIRHCYYTSLINLRLESTTNRGLWLPCLEGDADANVHLYMRNVFVNSCAVGGIDGYAAESRNEGSDFTFVDVSAASCGTADSSSAYALPATFGIKWSGQVFKADNVSITTCEECGLWIKGPTGGSGLGNTVKIAGIALENNRKRAFVCSGMNNIALEDFQIYQNDTYRAAVGVLLYGNTNLIRNFSALRCFFRPSDGMRACTVTDATNLVGLTAHGFAAGDIVEFGTTANGLTAATRYYVRATNLTADAFEVSLTDGGAAVNITSDGTNTVGWRYLAHHASGANVQYAVVWQPSWYLSSGVTTVSGLGERYSTEFRATNPTILDGGDLIAGNTFSLGTLNASSRVAVGATPGAQGDLRTSGLVSVCGKAADGTTDIRYVRRDGSNNLTFGDTTAAHWQASLGSTSQFQFIFGAVTGWITYIVSGNSYIDTQGRHLFIEAAGATATVDCGTLSLVPTSTFGLLIGASARITANSTGLSFFSRPPCAQFSAYTQTYSTADKTLSAYTPDVESSAYTGIDNAQGGSVYATVADLNALRVAYENLRVFAEDGVQVTNALVDDLQNRGDIG